MKTTIKTKGGPRTIPDWAQCHCVSRHSPSYIHPYPFALPSGDELWLCPTTYHQANILLDIYQKLDGPPERRQAVTFNYFVRSLITMYWQQVLEQRHDAEVYQGWLDSRNPDRDNEELFEDIKRLVADE